MSKYKVLAIDFDHTIHDTANPVPGKKMGAPIVDAKEALQHFRAQGYQIVIHTAWRIGDDGRLKVIKDWLDFYGIPYDDITNIKPKADAYIDDKAIRFEGNWEEIINKIP